MQKTIHINGRDVFVWEFGKASAQPLVFLHGYAGDHQGLVDIAKQFPQFHVIVPDLPGFGRSQPLRGKHDIKNYVAFVHALCQEFHVQNGLLFGHSLGGSIGLSFLETHPQVFEKASLACPVLTSEHWMATAAKWYYQIAEFLPRDWKKFMVDNKFLVYLTDSIVMTVQDKQKRKEILEQNYINYKQADADALSQAFFTFFEDDILSDPKNICAKTQIVGAENDIISPVGPLKKLHETIEGSDFVVVPEAGHLLPREYPEKVWPILQDFLKE